MKRAFAGDTDTGCVRSANQDSFHIDPAGRFFIVADGMGGHAGGEVASRLATETVMRYLDLQWDSSDPQGLLQESILLANQAILNDQNVNSARRDMGTTIVIVIFKDDEAYYCHIGDSRLYRLRGAKLEQISEDHTWIAKAIQSGTITLEESRTHPWRHMLMQCLGREDIKETIATKIDFQPGDRLLMCSDGLTEELTNERIASQLKSIRGCEQAASALIAAAKAKGGRDNITVVIISNELLGNNFNGELE